jgi:hypothetical protein
MLNKYPIVFSDKTGTLTVNEFDVSKSSHIMGNLLMLLGHTTGFEFDGQVWNDCMELKALMRYLKEHHKVKYGNEHIFKDHVGSIQFTINDQIVSCNRHIFESFSYDYNGVHSLIEIDGLYYHCVSGNIAILSKRLKYERKSKDCNLRGFMFAAIPLLPCESLDKAFSKSKNKFVDGNIDEIESIPLAEIYFENAYQKFDNQTTKSGIEDLLAIGCPFVMCTGDNVATAEAIGKDLGINGSIYDTSKFLFLYNLLKLQNDEEALEKETLKLRPYFLKIVEDMGAIFACAKPQDKETLIILTKKFCEKEVAFCGDQDNDYLAIKAANFSVAPPDGCNLVKSAACMIAKVPTAALALYLKSYNNWGTNGKLWFFQIYTMFNYITTAFWLIGIFNQNFSNNSVLYDDPWSSKVSLPMSGTILSLCIIVSMFKVIPPTWLKNMLCKSRISQHKQHGHNEILYIAPIIAFCCALVLGITLISVPFISIMLFTLSPLLIIGSTSLCFLI